jgi:glucan phosphoethanolaminetransferase (alkaline phosphatase superfamily)
MLSICCLLFIVTGIQFWISDYMQTVLKVDPGKVFTTFAVCSITAPVLGVIAGGYLITKLGGYTNKTALEACFKISILAGLSGAFLPVIDNFPLFVILMWLLLFFGASIVPGLTGIMLSSTPEGCKEIANSITHLCYNLIGYLPSPFLYGLVCKYTGGAESRYGLAFILLWSYFGVFFLFLAKYYKNVQVEKRKHSIKDSPFESNSAGKETKEDSDEFSTDNKHLEEKTGALTALYGRISNL